MREPGRRELLLIAWRQWATMWWISAPELSLKGYPPLPENWRSIWNRPSPNGKFVIFQNHHFFEEHVRFCGCVFVKDWKAGLLSRRFNRHFWWNGLGFGELKLFLSNHPFYITYPYMVYVPTFTIKIRQDPSWLIPFTWKAGRLFHWGDLGCDSLLWTKGQLNLVKFNIPQTVIQ